MEHRPHDSLAKLIVSKLANKRETVPEAEMRIPIKGDVLLRPGPALPSWTGLLGTMVGTGVTVLEFYHGRPRAHELVRARAKGLLASALELEKQRRGFSVSQSRVLILTLGLNRRALEMAYPEEGWKTIELGFLQRHDAPDQIILDLTCLRVDRDTAWLHVAGGSPRSPEALTVLMAEDGSEVKALLKSLREEVTFMPKLREALPANDEVSRALFFLKSFERAEIMAEGLKEGERKGLNRGTSSGRRKEAERALEVVLSARFGASHSLSTRLKKLSSIEALEDLLRVAATASEPGLVEAHLETLIKQQVPVRRS